VTTTFPPSLSRRANCAVTDGPSFYPSNTDPVEVQKRVCANCVVRLECLDWALGVNGNSPERFGIWGGKSKPEREQIRREMGLAADTEQPGQERAS
jgi:WhiB family redox-sensing transcriptional regulator